MYGNNIQNTRTVQTTETTLKRHSRYISNEVRTKVWNRDNGQCVMCGRQENLEFDHIIPFSKGGNNSEDNIQLLCQKCNAEKRDKI